MILFCVYYLTDSLLKIFMMFLSLTNTMDRCIGTLGRPQATTTIALILLLLSTTSFHYTCPLSHHCLRKSLRPALSSCYPTPQNHLSFNINSIRTSPKNQLLRCRSSYYQPYPLRRQSAKTTNPPEPGPSIHLNRSTPQPQWLPYPYSPRTSTLWLISHNFSTPNKIRN